MEDGIIKLDTERAKEFDFTSDKFDGWLWKKDNYIYISFIVSKQQGKGNLSILFKSISEKGYGIKVPTPFARMESIVKNHGFRKTREYFKAADEMVEVWVKE